MKRQSTDGPEADGTEDLVRGKKRKVEAEVLPPGVNSYTRDSIPWDLLNYWHQRFSLFSLWDQGIWITDEGFYSVTPEAVARKIAGHILPPSLEEPQIILDAFCGVGGNAIQFALLSQCKKVIALDHDEATLECARHNAKIYGVEEKIEFIKADFFDYAAKWKGEIKLGAVFLSPPWGGPGYKHETIFDLESMTYGGLEIYNAARNISPDIVLYLPRNGDLNQIAKYDAEAKDIKVIHYCLQARSKAICVYFGKTGASIR